MKVFVLFDKISKKLVDCFLSENNETAIRRIRVQLDTFNDSKNYGAITMLRDCTLYEVPNSFESYQNVLDVSTMIVDNEKAGK